MADSNSVREVFDTLLHGGLPDSVREETARLFSHEIFNPRSNLTEDQRSRLNLQRLRHVSEELPKGTNLALNPELMFTLVAAAAVVDPALSATMIIHHGLCLSFLEDFGTELDWLNPVKEELAAGRTVGSFMVTEVGHGNSQLSVRTEAKYDRQTGDFVLHTPDLGAQKFMANTGLDGVPRIAVVLARLIVDGIDRGAFPFLVQLSDGHKSLRGVHTARIYSTAMLMDYSLTRFDYVRLPHANWLSDTASISDDGIFTDPLTSRDERLLRSISTPQNVCTGMSDAMATVSRISAASALRFSTQRRTTARIGTHLPVLEYTTQQRPLFGCLAEAMAISCLANAARSTRIESIKGWRHGERPRPSSVDTMTWAPWVSNNRDLSMTKVMVAWATERITEECRLRCGVLGALTVSRFLDYQGLGHMLNAGGGDNLLIVLDTGRSLASNASELPPPDSSLRTQESDLLDQELWRELQRCRVFYLAMHVSSAIAQISPQARDSFEAWNPELMQVRELGEAYGHGLVLESMLTAVDKLPAGEGADVARTLCAIYALEQLARNAAWFICEGLLSIEQVRDIGPTLDKLARSLAPHTDDLVAAFAANGSLARSPLLTDDYIQAISTMAVE